MEKWQSFIRTILTAVSFFIALTPTFIMSSSLPASLTLSPEGAWYGLIYIGMGTIQLICLVIWGLIIYPMYKK